MEIPDEAFEDLPSDVLVLDGETWKVRKDMDGPPVLAKAKPPVKEEVKALSDMAKPAVAKKKED